MKEAMNSIIAILESCSDIDISYFDDAFLHKVIKERQNYTNIHDVNDYIEFLCNHPQEPSSLFSSLLNNYTEFFRNTLTYYYLETDIIPKLARIKKDKEIRIWVNGCSTGEEAYSILMLLEEYKKKQASRLEYRIFATDIDALNIEKAKEGIYSVSKVQNLQVKYLNRFFIENNNCFHIKKEFKKHISFSEYDLFDIDSNHPTESIYGNFDIVTCCNIIYYYRQTHQDFIVNKLINSLSNQGYFITDETEKSNISKYEKIHDINPYVPIYKLKIKGAHDET